MDVSIITVTWNSEAQIEAQLRSVVFAGAGLEYEQFVVDNASSDRTVEVIRASGLPITVISLSENKGFAFANNNAFYKATGKYLLFLNPDMELAPDALHNAIQFMETHPQAAIASGLLTDTDGKMNTQLRPRQFPRRRDQLMIFFKLHRFFPALMKKYTGDNLDLTKEQKVDSVRGSCMIVRRSFLETLGFAFDPRYFIWYEDVDICREAYAKGFEVWFTPSIRAKDFVGKSFAKQRLFWKQKQLTRSMIMYEKKWGHPLFAFFLSLCRFPLLFLAWLHDAARIRSKPSRI